MMGVEYAVNVIVGKDNWHQMFDLLIGSRVIKVDFVAIGYTCDGTSYIVIVCTFGCACPSRSPCNLVNF